MTLALVGILGIAGWCAYRVIVAARAVIAAAEDTNTYALFVTDEGLKSDNERLASEVNHGVDALRSAESEASLLICVCVVLGVALGWRLWRSRSL